MGSNGLRLLRIFITLAAGIRSVSPSWYPQCSGREPEKDYITRCDFNDNSQPFCKWIQTCGADSGEWIRTNGGTPTQHTGPSGDHPAPWSVEMQKGYYIYQEASNFIAGQSIRLESPPLNLSGDACVEFSYHMYGPHDERAKLKILAGYGSGEVLLWNRTLPQSHAWLLGSVTVPGSDQVTQVIFEAERGLTEEADIAVDNIAVVAGPCLACVHGCNFDEDQCGWVTETATEDAGDEGWIQGTGDVPDFTRPGFGRYMLLDSAFNKPGHRFHLKSPSVNSTQCLLLSFYYYLYGSASTMALNVYAKRQGSLGMLLLDSAGNHGQRWWKTQAVYCGDSPVQFVIEGVTGEEKTSQLAVDKVCIVPCTGVTGVTTQPSTTFSRSLETTTGNTTAESTTCGKTAEPATDNSTPEGTTQTTAGPMTVTTPGPTTVTTPGPTTVTKPESTNATTPEPMTVTTPESTNATTPEPTTVITPQPTTVTTPDPTTVTTPESTNATTPGPMTVTTPESTNATTPEPTTVITPEPTNTTTPQPTTVTTPGPTNTTTPGPMTVTTPESTNATTPRPMTVITPEPMTVTTPESTNATTPEPTTVTTPESTNAITPEPMTVTTPESTNTTTPEPMTVLTTEPMTVTTPGPMTVTTPGPTTVTTPESTNATTPGPMTVTTPESTNATTPEPTTVTTPESTNATTREPTTMITPEPITVTTPESTNATTAGPMTVTTPESTNATTPEPMTVITPEPNTVTTAESTNATTPGPMTVTTPESTNATTPGPMTVTTPESTNATTAEPTTVTSPESTNATTPGPMTVTTPESTNATTAEPTTVTSPESTNATTPGPMTVTTPESTNATTAEPMTVTTPESTNAATPGPTTVTTPESTNATTPEPTTVTTPEPTTVTTPESTNATTPEPTTVTTPESTNATTPEPTTVTTPEPMTVTTPESTNATTPEPTTVITTEPMTVTTPESTNATTPGPMTVTTPESTNATTPEPTTVTTPESTNATTREPTTMITPEPITVTTPESTNATTAGPMTVTTPESTNATTPEPMTVITPEPNTVTTAESTNATTPGPMTVTTPESTNATTAEPTTVTSPVSTNATTPGPMTVTTPESTNAATPGPTTVTTPESTNATTEEPTTVITAKPTTVTTPGSTNATPVPTTVTTPESTNATTPGRTTITTPESTNATPGPTTVTTPESTNATTAEPTTVTSPTSTTLSTPSTTVKSTPPATVVTSRATTVETTPEATPGGSCIISGDPHYITFDKRRFTFLGTCTYTLARTCQGSMGGPEKDSSAESRGTRPPLSVRPVRMVSTDFGLLLQYDGNHFVKIQVPGSYMGRMCGLCGDFNGNRGDDYRKPDGTMAGNDTVFGDSWKTKDDEEERCRSIQPTPCSEEIYDKVIGTSQCGLITEPTGPFRDCATIVDPKPYFDSCVYDMCQFQGLQPPLCDQLQAYTDACQSAGATVHSWRTADFCALHCPPNSHYGLCVSLCPGTCTQPGGGGCSSKCVEGCACNPGYVLSDGECVPLSSCGCTDQQGDYHVISESWFLAGCTQRCTCISPNRVECRGDGCRDSEKCGLLDGVYGCHPKDHGTCSASGDPHYKTFDKVYYDFMGNCTYTFSRLCQPTSDLPHFNVETSNEHRGGSTRVSYVKAVHVEVYDHRVTMAKGRRVMVDGRSATTPVFLEGQLQVRISGGYVSLETAFGLLVRYDGTHRVELTVPSSYSGQLCGLCGNYNGLMSDDKRLPDGQDADSFEDLGAGWLVPGTDTHCTHDEPPSDCDEDEAKESWSCGFIKDPKGPFRECNKHISMEQHFKDCVYDVSCGPSNEMVSLCFALQSYADLCAQAGVPVTWRNKTFCPLSCPAGSHYEPCSSACPASCTDLSAPNDCSGPCVEACACDPGYVLSGDKCVAFDQCGCVDTERNYRLLGENWITNGNCSERCTCSGPSNITCEQWECGPLDRCQVLDGVLGCHTSGSASCHVAGDPHYYTFDNAMHTFLGTCTYTLVTVCNASMVTPFTISAKNEERGLQYASYLSQINVDVLGLHITLQKNRRIKLNEEKIRTPFEDDVRGISIYTNGIYNVLETKFGLMVRFDGNHHLEIKLPNSYYGKVCGMCGNFNNDASDDLLMPNGAPARDVPQFGNSWQVTNDDDSRCQSDDRDDLAPPCSPGEETVRRSQCEELLSAKYRPCHRVVKPAPFVENCVYDLCMYAGMISTLCDNVQSYVEACKSEGIDIKWRNSTFCPLACGKDSHYTECASPCPATCTDIYASSTCESNRACVEGCQCDSGFVLSDNRCVRLEDCGCVDYNNDYHESGDKWLNKRCDTKCTCNKGQLSCKAHKCSENSVCALKKDGRYKCRPVSFEACLISGDPHYLTFDGLAHHFQGKGTYTLATTYADSETLQPFNIEGRNKVRRGNEKVSYLATVYVDVYGHSIEFHKRKRLLLDDEEVTPPYKSREGFHIYQKSRTLYLETDFGLSVNFDGKENADIIVPSLYKRKVRGLCGNYDGRYRNDFTLPDGTRVSDLEEFGNSWEVEDDDDDDYERKRKWTQPSELRRFRHENIEEGTDPKPETGYVSCDASTFNSTTQCGALLNPQGPFRNCHPFIEPELYYRNCLYDLCQTADPEMLCASFEMYVQACQANGTALPDWRKYTGCAMACPPNSSYRPCMAACPPTCANLAAPSECDSPCMEGCECNRGFVYSGFDCVPYSQCGCTYRNKYYEVGERFLTDDCTEDCNCNMTDTIQCSTMRCPENTTCTIINSKRTCGLTCGSGTCQNGGTCAKTKSGIKCLCRPLYRGRYCEDNTIIIIIAVLVPIVVLLIGALMIYLFYCRNGGVKGSDSTSDISSIVSYDNIADLTQSWQLDQGARHGGVSNPQYQC